MRTDCYETGYGNIIITLRKPFTFQTKESQDMTAKIELKIFMLITKINALNFQMLRNE